MKVAGPEPYKQMVLRDASGANLAWVGLDSSIQWTGPLRGHSNGRK